MTDLYGFMRVTSKNRGGRGAESGGDGALDGGGHRSVRHRGDRGAESGVVSGGGKVDGVPLGGLSCRDAKSNGDGRGGVRMDVAEAGPCNQGLGGLR